MNDFRITGKNGLIAPGSAKTLLKEKSDGYVLDWDYQLSNKNHPMQ